MIVKTLASAMNVTMNCAYEIGQMAFQTAQNQGGLFVNAVGNGICKYGSVVVFGEAAVTLGLITAAGWATKHAFQHIKWARMGVTHDPHGYRIGDHQILKYTSIATGCAAIALYNIYSALKDYSETSCAEIALYNIYSALKDYSEV